MDDVIPDWLITASVLQRYSVSNITTPVWSSTGVRPGATLLFLLYMVDLFDVIAECGFHGHSFADDTQIYILTPANDDVDAVKQLSRCIEQIPDWMVSN